MKTNDECTHDYLDPEGFCIDCGVHVSDRLSVPKQDDDDKPDDVACGHKDIYEDERTGAITCTSCGAVRDSDGFWYH